MYPRNFDTIKGRVRIPGTRPFEPEGRVSKVQPARKWTGGWKPRETRETLTMGVLSDDLAPLVARDPAAFGIMAPLVAPVVQPTPFALPQPAQESPSIWQSLIGGVSSIINARVGGEVQRQQQQAAARAWNPAITGPALQAQAWQQAYTSGTGMAPGISTGALVVGGAVLLGVVLLASRK